MGVRAGRMSLDGDGSSHSSASGSGTGNGNGNGSRTATVHAADRNAAGGKLPPSRRERRRTVTEIWPRE